MSHRRRHHNTKGNRQIQNGKTSKLASRLNRELSKSRGRAKITPSPPSRGGPANSRLFLTFPDIV